MILSDERRRALTAKAQAYAAEVEHALPYLLSRGISREVAEMFSLGYVPTGEEFAGRLSIPYMDPAGCSAIKFRCADLSHHQGFKHVHDKCAKYLYPSGTSVGLFNAQVLIYETDRVVVTEGEMDAICIQAYAGLPAVAYPGVSTWSQQSYWRLCFEGVQEVIVVADGDEPGRAAAAKVAQSIGAAARVVEMPAGHDANSYVASEGAGAFLERLQ